MSFYRKVDLVGVGLNATDTVLQMPVFPTLGSKVEFHSSSIQLGGQVASAVIACQNWGLQTRYVGKFGNDEAAKLHREVFEKKHVEAQLVAVPGCPSQQTVILVDRTSGERTVLWHRDERLALRPNELKEEWITSASALLVDGYDTEAAITAARWANEAGVPVVGDLDELYNGVEQLLPRIDYLIVSRDFSTRLMQEPSLEKAVQGMQAKYECKLAAATLGPEGVLAYDGQEFHYQSSYRVPVADTTGAGDIFHAGFLYGLVKKWELPKQLDFACAAAALNCTELGARGGIKSLEEIADLMASGDRYPETQLVALQRN